MARYLFRLSVLGPRALLATQVNAAVDDAFRRFGFEVEDATITNVKGLAPPILRMDPATLVATYITPIPGQAEWDSQIGPAGGAEAAAARAVRVLTTASIVIHGTLPPTNASGRGGRAQVSDAVFAAVNASLGPQGFFNLTGPSREAGLVASGGGGGGGSFAILVGLGLVYMATRSSSGALFGLKRRRPMKRRRTA